jgi:acyl-homoserine lactone acylase PvdQ
VMQINDINQAIIQGNFTNDQLDSITMAVKYARNQLGHQNKRQLRVGGAVRFHNSRRGYDMHGKVAKIAIKFVTVDCGVDGRWKVPANMLTVLQNSL